LNSRVGSRVFKYNVGELQVYLLQFNSTDALNAWADMVDSTPIGGSTVIRKGRVGIQVWPGPDEQQQVFLNTVGASRAPQCEGWLFDSGLSKS
jgi:hypothetical protein